jgi:hypothetical protein
MLTDNCLAVNAVVTQPITTDSGVERQNCATNYGYCERQFTQVETPKRSNF